MEVIGEEQAVKDFLRKYGCQAEQYPKSCRHKSTPDFQVSSINHDFFFLCEVKTIKSKDNKGILNSTVFNLFVTKIHEAVGQFNSVNSKHIVPNLLLFYTNEFRINWNTFKDFLQGFISAADGSGIESRIANLRKVSQSRIRKEILDVDLFLFLQGNVPTFFFTSRDKNVIKKFSLLFNIELSNVQSLEIN